MSEELGMTDEANAGAAGLIPEKLDPVRCAEKRLEYSGTVITVN